MPAPASISSAQNPRIKGLLALQEKSRERRERGLFPVEGVRELEHCLRAGFHARTLYFCPDILPQDVLARLQALAPGAECIGVPAFLYEKIALRGGTEGVVAEIEWRERTLEDLVLPEGKAPLVMVLEGVEKPGNVGAVLRSADAAGVDAVLLCDCATDLYNPNLVRASLGAVFTRPLAVCRSEEGIAWLKRHGIKIFTAQLQDSSPCYETAMTGPTALVMGTESTGLTDCWRKAADAHLRIPMLGEMDSLNVSVSAAVLLYEAVRQRLAVSGTRAEGPAAKLPSAP